jgi:hypothetical protein
VDLVQERPYSNSDQQDLLETICSTSSSVQAAQQAAAGSSPGSAASTPSSTAEASSIQKNISMGLSSAAGRKVVSFTYSCWRGEACLSLRPCYEVPVASAKVGCRFRLRVEVWQYPDRLVLQPIERSPHTGHVLGSHEDAVLLRPSGELLAEAKRLLLLGKTPYMVYAMPLNNCNQQHEGRSNSGGSSGAGPGSSSSDGSSGAGPGSSSSDGSSSSSSAGPGSSSRGSTFPSAFTSLRGRLSLTAIKNVQKQIAQEFMIAESDVQAVEQLVSHLQQQGPDSPVLFYQPQQVDAEDNITQHLMIVLSSPFGLAMPDAFGAGDDRMVLLDATGGTNQYGYMLHSLLVVDEWMEGVPAAFLITSDQEAAAVEKFLQVSCSTS